MSVHVSSLSLSYTLFTRNTLFKFSILLLSKALEEKLALATKKESELQAKIAHLEDSASTASLDEVRKLVAL